MNRTTRYVGWFTAAVRPITIALGVWIFAACGGGESDSSDGASGGGLGPLEDAVTVGAKSDWMHSFDSGTYRMENRGDPTNVRYFYVSSPEEHHGRRTVEVRVEVEGSPDQSRAGLLYGLQEQPRRYYAIVTDGEGMIEVYQRDADGLQLTLGSSVQASSDGITRIQVEEDGRELTIRGNGRSIGSFESAGTGTGAAGILAMGPGSFSFTDFRISPEPNPDRSATPASLPNERGDPAMQETRMPEVQYYPVRDQVGGRTRGMITSLMPFPADWRIREDANGAVTTIEGPGGILVHPSEVSPWAWSQDPGMRETLAQMGHRLAPVKSVEQILEQDLRPWASSQGMQLVRTYPVPEVEAQWQLYLSGLAETGSRRRVWALGTEWAGGQGKKMFLLLVLYVIEQPPSISWLTETTRLEAPAEVFADAKADYLYAVGNTRYNPQWQAVSNGEMIENIKSQQELTNELMRQSARAHQQRMAAINAQGNTARSVGQTYSDILDISHQGFLERDDINTAGHANLIDTINERSVIGNHETGEHYDVPAGARHYWVRNDAYYMGTDNINFDPNLDPRMNQFEWTKFLVER